MPKHPLMRLFPDETAFLRQWMHDEVHYQEGTGPAKRLQVQHGVSAADLALLIAAAIPDPAEQEAAARDQWSTDQPLWPWTGKTLPSRLAEARAVLDER